MVKLAAVCVAALALVSCSPATRPNQIDSFDGSTYDTLLLAHEALASLRSGIATHANEFAPDYNGALRAYTSAVAAYSQYRLSPGPASTSSVNVLVSGLGSAVASLEQEFSEALPVPESKRLDIEAHVSLQTRRLSSMARYAISLSDILSALEIGAQIASQVPQSAPEGALALLIIHATQAAEAAAKAHAGQPIDLRFLQPPLPLAISSVPSF